MSNGKSLSEQPGSGDKQDGRRLLLNYLELELNGPAGGLSEELGSEPPYNRYTLGVLFPQELKADEDTEAEEDDETAGDPENGGDDPVSLANRFLPSSVGLSFYFSGPPVINVAVHAALYKRAKEGSIKWYRIPLADRSGPEQAVITQNESENRTTIPVLNGNAEISTRWRNLGDGFLVTVTMVNTVRKNSDEIYGEDCLYQAGFSCKTPEGEIREYPGIIPLSSSGEEAELELLYRNHKVFAVGHGCAAEWITEKGKVNAVCTTVLPSAVVRSVSHDIAGSPEILQLSRLADPAGDRDTLICSLEAFTAQYESWIKELPGNHPDIPHRLSGAKQSILSRLQESLGRMRAGIALLSSSDDILKAFRFANMAMLMQMHHGSPLLGGSRKLRDRGSYDVPDYLKLTHRWRPFQLAFQLLAIESVANDQSPYRDTADLIWFPTGGGKTEAYLAVAAFEIFRRRIVLGARGCGTSVITRYTLRLLTSQQFQRAARMIAACEIIRRNNQSVLGRTPVSIGFWAGTDTSPNTFKDARKALNKIKTSANPAAENVFQLDLCPWCGTEMLPQRSSADSADFGFSASGTSFQAKCPSSACAFHGQLPVSAVDEEMYLNPPSFLIGTVDKFARLAWTEGPGRFFGTAETLPPSLIIQDEMHLLSGPLGTTFGLYESAVEGLLAMKGMKAKIIASTATIRSAGQQISGLFGKRSMVFPSPGLSADDSFFARTDYDAPGRLYAGVMSSSHRSTTSAIRNAAALLQGVAETEKLSDEEKNAYWTLVIYHLSLRELGKTISFASDDIPARMKIIASSAQKVREIFAGDVIELTSNLSARAIPATLERMSVRYDQSSAVSILACTNMLSVGVDVPRLGLMVVNGQPKTTSEYIQASSRVGRGSVPGLVITHYSASKPRDRSHYESFKAYHSGIYRYVEPASVTTFSLPSRNRALHAALVILIRHGAGLSVNEAAGNFSRELPGVQQAADILAGLALIKDPAEAANTRAHIDRLLDEWQQQARDASRLGYQLVYYEQHSKNVRTLLTQFGKAGPGWPTLNSMRNVDAECEISLTT